MLMMHARERFSTAYEVIVCGNRDSDSRFSAVLMTAGE
jgi:hypothetical protein